MLSNFLPGFLKKHRKGTPAFRYFLGARAVKLTVGVLDSWLVLIWLVASGLTVASDGFGWEPKLQNESLQVFAGGHCCRGLLPNPCRPPSSCNKENKRYH